MTTEDYLKRMAELGVDRAGLEIGLPEFSRASVRATKVGHYLPEWENARQRKRKVGRKPKTK